MSCARRAKAYVQSQGLRVDSKRSGPLSKISPRKRSASHDALVSSILDLEIEDTGIVVVLTGEESTLMVGGCKHGLMTNY